MADALDLGSSGETHPGSSPGSRSLLWLWCVRVERAHEHEILRFEDAGLENYTREKIEPPSTPVLSENEPTSMPSECRMLK